MIIREADTEDYDILIEFYTKMNEIINVRTNKGSIIFFVGLTLPRYSLLLSSASLDMKLRQCVG